MSQPSTGMSPAPAGRPVAAARPDAFILTGSLLVICRSPLYLDELTRRGLKVLVITPSNFGAQARDAVRTPGHPAGAIDQLAFVDGEASRENSYVAGVIAAARRWRESYRIVGVCAVGETQVEPTGLLADALGLPSPGLRATRVCRNKLLQRWYLPEFSPPSAVIAPAQRAAPDLAGISFPAVVKPVGRHSSSGVHAVSDAGELAARLAAFPPHETLLVEQQVTGQEFSVESLVQDRQVRFASVTHKVTTDTRTRAFVELAHTIPNGAGELDDVLLDANRRMLAALAFENGVTHAEWRIDRAGRPILMEVAARPPGDGICELYHLATGAPLEPQIIRIALGEPASLPPVSRHVRQIYLEHQPGILQDVSVNWDGVSAAWVGEGGLWPRIGPTAPADPPTLRAVLVHFDRGAELGPLDCSEDRVASLFIDAATRPELDGLERRVRQAVTVHTTPTPTPAATSATATGPAPGHVGAPAPDTVSHVLVGYSPVMLGKLDSMLPERSVLVLEEPAVVRARGLRAAVAGNRCVAELREVPSQDDQHPDRIVAAVPRPPGVQVVVPVVEYGVVAAAALAEAWGLPGAGSKAATILRDKALLRQAIAGTDIAQPAWTVAREPADVIRFRSHHHGECVLKPANRQASVGVQRLGPDDDVSAAWQHTTGADEPTLRAHYPGADRFLVEQRLHGPEVSVEALVHAGVVAFANVTVKQLLDSRYPVETGHTLPADLPDRADRALREAVDTLVAATGFGAGILHAEWIMDGDRPQLVECAARMPGDRITVLLDLAYRTNILAQLLLVLAGRPPTLRPPAVQGAAVRFLVAPPGTVAAIEGVAAARAAPGVHDLHLDLAPGDRVRGTTNSWERAGLVVAVGIDGAEAARHADQAAAQIRLHTTPDTP